MKKIALLIAATPEADAILKDSYWNFEKKENYYYSRKYPLTLAITGVGKVFAAATAVDFIDDSVDHIINFGSSASLNENCRAGNYLIPERTLEWDMEGFERAVTPFSPMKGPFIATQNFSPLEKIIESETTLFHEGKDVCTADFILEDEKRKAEIKEAFPSLVAFDMESAALAKVCNYVLKKPFMCIRFISDNGDEGALDNWQQVVKESSSKFNEILKLYFK